MRTRTVGEDQLPSYGEQQEGADPAFVLLSLLEPATWLTVGIGLAYFFGRVELISYYSRLGVSLTNLDLPISEYVYYGTFRIIFALLPFVVLRLGAPSFPTAHRMGWLPVAAFFGGIIGIVIGSEWLGVGRESMLATALLVVLFGALAILTKVARPGHAHVRLFQMLSVLVGLGAFVTLFLVCGVLGQQRAERFLEQTHGSRVLVSSTAGALSTLQGKKLRVIVHNANRYLLVEGSVPAAQDPVVYIVSDDDIQLLTSSSNQAQ